MDTLGSIVDKICTVNNKMFMEQEKLYAIRRMTFEEFRATYQETEKLKELYEYFHKAADLNLQRNQFIDEIDLTVVKMIEFAQKGVDLYEAGYVQKKHKTL